MTIVSKLSLVLLVSISSLTAGACTTFCILKDGKKVFGKNYDWVTGTGTIHTNLSGLHKTAFSIEPGNNLKWTARYGSITFNQFGKEFPNGGMNEKGLVVELMWLNESSYPQKDKRPSLSVLQWIQYQLDNAATVEEVIASDKNIRVFSTGTPQHYLVADKKGSVATIEFLNGKMEVHTDKSLPHAVLANSTYATSLASIRDNSSKGNNSLQRFTTACEMIKTYQAEDKNTPPVEYAFEVLQKVAQGDFTKWSIVYDIDNLVIHFKTGGRERRLIRFNDFSFNCNSLPLAYHLEGKHSGDVTTQFSNYSSTSNELKLKQAFKESRSQFSIPMQLQDEIARLPKAFSCADEMLQ